METELAWAAGFFDGEGHVSCRESGIPYIRKDGSKGKHYFSVRTCVVQAGDHAEYLLNRFNSAVGNLGKITKHKSYPNRLQRYNWVCDNTQKTILVYKLLQPYLGPAKDLQFKNSLKEIHAIV